MLVLSAPIRFRLAADVATASVLVAGVRAVLVTQEWLAADWIAVQLEAALVGVAVPPRRSGRSLAILDGARVLPRHAGAGLLDDLTHPLARDSQAGADACEVLAGLVAVERLGVSLLDFRASSGEDASSLTHRATYSPIERTSRLHAP